MNNDEIFKVYDISVDEFNIRYLDLYNVGIEKYKEKSYYYIPSFVDTCYPENLEKEVKKLRREGYVSALEFGLVSYDIPCDNIIANYMFSIIGQKIVPLEYIYYSQIKNNISYLMGAVIYVDVISGKEYVIKTRDFGSETSKLVNYVENAGYKHISNTSLWGHFDKINTSFARELKK